MGKVLQEEQEIAAKIKAAPNKEVLKQESGLKVAGENSGMLPKVGIVALVVVCFVIFRRVWSSRKRSNSFLDKDLLSEKHMA